TIFGMHRGGSIEPPPSDSRGPADRDLAGQEVLQDEQKEAELAGCGFAQLQPQPDSATVFGLLVEERPRNDTLREAVDANPRWPRARALLEDAFADAKPRRMQCAVVCILNALLSRTEETLDPLVRIPLLSADDARDTH